MAILQGSGYELPIKITDAEGRTIDASMVVKASFTFGDLTKNYGFEDDGIYYDNQTQSWILPLTEDETFRLKGTIEWQARFLLSSGKTDGTIPKKEIVYNSINKTLLSEVEEDA